MKKIEKHKNKHHLDQTDSHFVNSTLKDAAISCNNILSENFDFEKTRKESREALQILGVQDGLEMMLATQMLSIHKAQVKMMMQANSSGFPDETRYCLNTATKLSNTFIQQATLLTKLQGRNDQKMTVKHVHVHDGGQAIVGALHTSGVSKKQKNENNPMHSRNKKA